MNVAFYFEDSQRYGNLSNELKLNGKFCFNTHYAWCWRAAASSDAQPHEWLESKNGLYDTCGRAVDAKRKIHLNLDLIWPTPIQEVLATLRDFKNQISAFEIGDEPPWNLSGTTRQAQLVRSIAKAQGYPEIPLMVTYSTKQFPVRAGKVPPYDAIDIIGVEAYVAPPGDHNAQYNADKLDRYLGTAIGTATKARKKVILIQQAYSRNYEWRDIGNPRKPETNPLEVGSPAWNQAVHTMVALVEPTLAWAKHSSVVGLFFFSWGRESGARGVPYPQAPRTWEYPALARECLRAGRAAMAIKR